MFTGLVEEVGKVVKVERSSGGVRICVTASSICEDIKMGDSIAVNGVCLTVVFIDRENICFDVSQETLERSNLSRVKVGDFVNLERALRPTDRLGGHFVQGHVDTTGVIQNIQQKGDHTIFVFSLPERFLDLVVEKGSIAIDGISLTVNRISGSSIYINIIPHTISNTNLKYRKVGDVVNIEFDILGKYVKNFISDKRNRLEELLKNF